MAIGGTPVPKREIIRILKKSYSEDRIRIDLKIQSQTDIDRRLGDFSKNQLIDILTSTEEGKNALEELKSDYPLTTNPTLYLISVSSWPSQQNLIENSINLADQGVKERVWFGSDHSVQSVYMIARATEYQAKLTFIEIPLVYEKKIEYVVSDPEVEEYGDIKVIYSLEKALIWYSQSFKHALLLCGDFPAVKPILYYGNSKLGIRWQLPYLSEEMLKRLAIEATPRTASFSRLEENPADELDVQTMTVSDQELGESKSYLRLTNDDTRHQTYGFFSSHPDLIYGGLGISRQYGRIWTPAHLRKDSLLALSINLIQKTEEELQREVNVNLNGFISYYRNSPMILAGKRVDLNQRSCIEELAKAIITARKSPNQESSLEPGLITKLVVESRKLDLIPAVEVHCDNCGDYLLRCPECQSPYEVIDENNQIVFECPNHPQQRIIDNQFINCECGANLEITYSTDIRIFPGAEILKSLHKFLDILENQHYDGSFIIIGNLFRLIPARRVTKDQYSLDSFRNWRVRAHLHQRNPADNRKTEYRHALNRIKEKCSRNNWHPTRDICEACMHEEISQTRILSGIEICLPRIFGYAIDMDFEGIHHCHEIADIRYRDILDETGDQLTLGIHLKSREKNRVKGLGRSVSSIKGLYTQYCYSTYLAERRGVNLNVIGISIPNIIKNDVIENFQFLANQLGFPLIILDEHDWINIIDAAVEKAEIDE